MGGSEIPFQVGIIGWNDMGAIIQPCLPPSRTGFESKGKIGKEVRKPLSMCYYCYMVRCANDAFYTGWTTDPIRRVKEHNAGRGARYTSMHRPVELVYVEEVEDHSAALKREMEIKRYTHQRKAKLAKSKTLPDGFNPAN